MVVALFIASLVSPQDVASLVDDLDADSLEVRELAERKLLAIGEPARPWLERASATSILDVLDVRLALGPVVLKEFPCIDLKVARGSVSYSELLGLIDYPTEVVRLVAGRALDEPFSRASTHRAVECVRFGGFTEHWRRLARIAETAPDEATARAAATALEWWLVPESIPHLCALLESPWPVVCESALRALAALDAKQAARRVAELCDDDSPVLDEAINTLAVLDPEFLKLRLASMLCAPDAPRAAIRAAGKLRLRECAGPIRALLEGPRYDARSDAIVALVELEERSALPAMIAAIALVTDRLDPFVAMLYVVEALGDRHSWQLIAAQLDHPNALVREGAVRTLAELNADDALPKIRALERDDYVRPVALEAVSRLTHGEAPACRSADRLRSRGRECLPRRRGP